MCRHLSFIGFTLLLLWAAGCKKDLLQLQKVQQLNSNTTHRLNRIGFITDSICFIGGGVQFEQATVLQSRDGGYTWTASNYPDAGKAMYGMGISPFGRLYMCGVDGTVLHTSDTGKSWQVSRIDDWQHYVGGLFVTPDTGVFVYTVLQRLSAITQVDANFKIISQDTFGFGLNDIFMVNPSTGYVVGYGAVMKTTDFRRTWVFQDVDGDNFTSMDIHGGEIWMCGAAGGIFHTTDGGTHWERLRNGNDLSLPRYMLRDLVFKDKLHGWAVGDKGVLIHTRDGGRHWMEYDRFTTNALRSIAICPNGDLLVAGDGGALYRITP